MLFTHYVLGIAESAMQGARALSVPIRCVPVGRFNRHRGSMYLFLYTISTYALRSLSGSEYPN